MASRSARGRRRRRRGDRLVGRDLRCVVRRLRGAGVFVVGLHLSGVLQSVVPLLTASISLTLARRLHLLIAKDTWASRLWSQHTHSVSHRDQLGSTRLDVPFSPSATSCRSALFLLKGP
jgi:hypothetical protein